MYSHLKYIFTIEIGNEYYLYLNSFDIMKKIFDVECDLLSIKEEKLYAV